MMERYHYVGKKIRTERLKYGLSLNDLATATELSASFLSLLENGKAVPSLKVLDKICDYFSIHMATLFEDESDDEMFYFPKEKHIEFSTENERILRFLLPKTKGSIEPVLITLYANSVNQSYTTHQGVEFGYVIEGTIEVHVNGKDPIICYEGDSVIYQANQPHKLVNPTDKIAKGLWLSVPNAHTVSQS